MIITTTALDIYVESCKQIKQTIEKKFPLDLSIEY